MAWQEPDVIFIQWFLIPYDIRFLPFDNLYKLNASKKRDHTMSVL